MNSAIHKLRRPLVAGAMVAVLALIGSAVWIHFHKGHGHGHDGHDAAALSLNDGKRWSTDEPLRTGMQRIRDVVVAALIAGDRRNLTAEQAKVLAESVQRTVAYLMQNCRLEPRADATLHVLISELMEGAALITANPLSEVGTTNLIDALRKYPEYFDHPNWSPLPEARP